MFCQRGLVCQMAEHQCTKLKQVGSTSLSEVVSYCMQSLEFQPLKDMISSFFVPALMG